MKIRALEERSGELIHTQLKVQKSEKKNRKYAKKHYTNLYRCFINLALNEDSVLGLSFI